MLKKIKVLIIDDSSECRLAISECVRSFPNFEVKACDNGADGIKLAKQWLPDIIFLDYLMTPIDGITAMKFLKSDSSTRNIFICMISANDIQSECSGCSFIRKPLSKSSIHKLLTEIPGLRKI
jgi:CheY-like chemotaxis protein